MGCVVFYPHSVLRLPFFAAFSKPNKLGNSVFSLKEITDGPSPFVYQRDLFHLTVSSIRSDGNRRGRPPRRSSDSERTAKDSEPQILQSADRKSSSNSTNQDEIIALFRRIQSSISKSDSVSTKKRSSKSSQDKSSATAESVLEVLRQSRKQVKDKPLKEEGNKVLARRGGAAKKEQKIQDNQSVVDLKSTRPPSSFVKRSPIPLSTTPRGNDFELSNEASQTIAGGEELVKVGEMKLTELKELAKSRGIKGYSKLKKSELVELLRS